MKKLIMATGFILLTMQVAQAGGVSPFYMGGSYGKTNNNTETENMFPDCTHPAYPNDSCTAEDSDKAWEVHAGINITKNISVEVGYADLGKTADMYYTDPIAIEQNTTAITAAGVVRMPLGKNSRASLYGKAGVARWESEVEVTPSGAITEVVKQGTYTKTGVSPVIGVGAEYDLTNNITLRAGIDRYYDVGEEDQALGLQFNEKGTAVESSYEGRTIKTDVDVISAGLNYQFF